MPQETSPKPDLVYTSKMRLAVDIIRALVVTGNMKCALFQSEEHLPLFTADK
ncbi:hypothetical protein RLEG12_22060 [Rhizobium leguminosarum bv. trifolii CB782]|nr:hypothetical protein RLEG12_22060 [Rhizobium leguminosarum bv. trifolii CB782]